jgi:guanine deaminase
MSGLELRRATIFHTPANAFHDERALVCHEDGGLLVGGGRVVACGEFDRLRHEHPDATLVDERGAFLLPGLVDAHVHFPQLRAIGGLGRGLLAWLDEVALPEEARMADLAYARDTARRFVRGLARSGTTAAMVFGAHFEEATAALFEAAAAAGLRIASGLVLSDRALRPELRQAPADAYRASASLIRRFHGQGRLLYAVTPRFALSTSEAMLEVCQTLVADHPGVRVQTHLNEQTDEVAQARRLFPWAGDYLAIYERHGLVTGRSVFAHDVHATDDEIGRLAGAGAAVAHCPASNAALGSGLFPLRRHVAAGVVCALGTDVGAGIGFGVLKEALQAYLLQRLAPDGLDLDAARLLYLSTLAGAEALGLADEIGDFRPGKAADFVCLRPPADSVLAAVLERTASPVEALAALVTLAGPETVREVRVAGEPVFQAAGA